MEKKAKVAITHSDADLGKPGEYSREQYARVKAMVKEVADGSVGGFGNLVKPGQTVLIKVNTVIPSPNKPDLVDKPLRELLPEQPFSPDGVEYVGVPLGVTAR